MSKRVKIWKPVDAETLVTAGDNLAAAFDLGEHARYNLFELHAVTGDGKPIGVRVKHGDLPGVAAGDTDMIVCEHGPYCFHAVVQENSHFRYLDVKSLADDTRVTVQRGDV